MCRFSVLLKLVFFITSGNHRLKSAFDMRSELFLGRPQIFTGFTGFRVSREKNKVDHGND